MYYKLLDKLMPIEDANPKELQTKIDDFARHNSGIDEDEFNTILAIIEQRGFAKGLRVGWQLCEETK